MVSRGLSLACAQCPTRMKKSRHEDAHEARELKGKASGLADYEARDRLATRRFWFLEEIERGIELTRTGF